MGAKDRVVGRTHSGTGRAFVPALAWLAETSGKFRRVATSRTRLFPTPLLSLVQLRELVSEACFAVSVAGAVNIPRLSRSGLTSRMLPSAPAEASLLLRRTMDPWQEAK